MKGFCGFRVPTADHTLPRPEEEIPCRPHTAPTDDLNQTTEMFPENITQLLGVESIPSDVWESSEGKEEEEEAEISSLKSWLEKKLEISSSFHSASLPEFASDVETPPRFAAFEEEEKEGVDPYVSFASASSDETLPSPFPSSSVPRGLVNVDEDADRNVERDVFGKMRRRRSLAIVGFIALLLATIVGLAAALGVTLSSRGDGEFMHVISPPSIETSGDAKATISGDRVGGDYGEQADIPTPPRAFTTVPVGTPTTGSPNVAPSEISTRMLSLAPSISSSMRLTSAPPSSLTDLIPTSLSSQMTASIHDSLVIDITCEGRECSQSLECCEDHRCCSWEFSHGCEEEDWNTCVKNISICADRKCEVFEDCCDKYECLDNDNLEISPKSDVKTCILWDSILSSIPSSFPPTGV